MIIAISLLISGIAFAQTSADSEIEDRAREIGRSLRCVVCQNQSIEESDAVLAEDMRTLVRTRLAAGDSNEDVINFMQDRYGDFVLLKPPVQSNTLLLWFGPFILLALMLLWFVFRTRNKKSPSHIIPPLDDEEKARLERLLDEDK
jgi:cytochrome c-type biogenesis protein CcmH